MRSPASATAASLLADLDARSHGRAASPRVLVLFDLNGFKRYNDTSATPPATRCWPASATRLVRPSATAAAPTASAATSSASWLARRRPPEPSRRVATAALSRAGRGLHGHDRLRHRDPARRGPGRQRRARPRRPAHVRAQERRARDRRARQTRDILLQVLREREPELASTCTASRAWRARSRRAFEPRGRGARRDRPRRRAARRRQGRGPRRDPA